VFFINKKNNGVKKMSKLIISADYYGKAILKVHRQDNISTTQLTHLLGCDTKQLHNYIYGANLIPVDTLRRVFKYAVMMDKMLQDK